MAKIINTTTHDQKGPESNGSEGMCHTLQISKTGFTIMWNLVSYPGHPFGGILPFCREYSKLRQQS